jgi:hypothetical protein
MDKRDGELNKIEGDGKKHCDSYCTVHGSSLECNEVSKHTPILKNLKKKSLNSAHSWG